MLPVQRRFPWVPCSYDTASTCWWRGHNTNRNRRSEGTKTPPLKPTVAKKMAGKRRFESVPKALLEMITAQVCNVWVWGCWVCLCWLPRNTLPSPRNESPNHNLRFNRTGELLSIARFPTPYRKLRLSWRSLPSLGGFLFRTFYFSVQTFRDHHQNYRRGCRCELSCCLNILLIPFVDGFGSASLPL